MQSDYAECERLKATGKGADGCWLTDREGGDALLVGTQGLGDGAQGAAVVAVLHVTQALLRLGELLQAVEPEVEVLRCHAGPQTLVELAGELVTSLGIDRFCFR